MKTLLQNSMSFTMATKMMMTVIHVFGTENIFLCCEKRQICAENTCFCKCKRTLRRHLHKLEFLSLKIPLMISVKWLYCTVQFQLSFSVYDEFVSSSRPPSSPISWADFDDFKSVERKSENHLRYFEALRFAAHSDICLQQNEGH